MKLLNFPFIALITKSRFKINNIAIKLLKISYLSLYKKIKPCLKISDTKNITDLTYDVQVAADTTTNIRQLLLKTQRSKKSKTTFVGVRRGKKQRVSFPIVKQFPMRVDRKSCLPNHEARNIRRGIFIEILVEGGGGGGRGQPSSPPYARILWRRRKKEALSQE